MEQAQTAHVRVPPRPVEQALNAHNSRAPAVEQALAANLRAPAAEQAQTARISVRHAFVMQSTPDQISQPKFQIGGAAFNMLDRELPLSRMMILDGAMRSIFSGGNPETWTYAVDDGSGRYYLSHGQSVRGDLESFECMVVWELSYFAFGR